MGNTPLVTYIGVDIKRKLVVGMIDTGGINWGALNLLVTSISAALITYYPFWKRVKIKPRFMAAIYSCIILAYIGIYYLLAPTVLSFSFLQAYKLALIIPCVVVDMLLVEDSKPKLLYFIAIMLTYVVTAVKIGNYLAFSLITDPSFSHIALINLSVFAVTMPLMLVYIHRVFEKTVFIVESSGKALWNIIWIIPGLFCFISLVNNFAFTPDIIIQPQFAFTTCMTIASLFIVTSILLRVLQIAAKTEILEQMSRQKTEFLSNVSHEMRTPLTVISVDIQTAAGILKHTDEAMNIPEAVELLTDAQEEIIRLAKMVGGMLTLASLSESAEKSKLDLAVILHSATDSLRLIVDKRGNKLETEIGGELLVFGNADLLSQVAINLIQNANAHTENGVIRLCAMRESVQITVTVSDNGSGITPELLPHVFERGVSEGGTGFGLYLCKTAVDAHSGEMGIVSELGKGTTVTFTLPVYQGQYGGDTE